MSGVTTSSLSLAWTLRNWVILDYEEANGLTVRPWAPFLSFQSLERRLLVLLAVPLQLLGRMLLLLVNRSSLHCVSWRLNACYSRNLRQCIGIKEDETINSYNERFSSSSSLPCGWIQPLVTTFLSWLRSWHGGTDHRKVEHDLESNQISTDAGHWSHSSWILVVSILLWSSL